MTYNQKEHEKCKELSKNGSMSVHLALLGFEHKKEAFLKGFDRWVE